MGRETPKCNRADRVDPHDLKRLETDQEYLPNPGYMFFFYVSCSSL
jgi:hypothetical protein